MAVVVVAMSPTRSSGALVRMSHEDSPWGCTSAFGFLSESSFERFASVA